MSKKIEELNDAELAEIAGAGGVNQHPDSSDKGLVESVDDPGWKQEQNEAGSGDTSDDGTQQGGAGGGHSNADTW